MTEHEKLEYIHCTLQDVQNCIEHAKLIDNPRWKHRTIALIDEDMIEQSMTMVEDIREKHFDDKGELIK